MPSYLIYGEDNFRAKQKIKQIKEKYVSASLGDTNLKIIEGKEVSFDQIVREIWAIPFLAKSRLLIIKNLLKEGKKDTQEKTAEFLKKIPSSTVVFFQEDGLPDKRTVLYKRLNQPGKAQEYKLLEEEQLKRWIKKEVEGRGGEIESDAVALLAEYVGPDLWRMTNEINKLIAYRLSQKPEIINIEDVKLLVSPEIKSDIFKLIDAIGAKNFRAAISEYEKLLKAGENELYILSMIVYQFRNLLIVKDLIERSPRIDRWQIAKKTGLHPFVVQKTLYQIKNFTLDKLKEIYGALLDFDVAIKTGKMEGKTALVLAIAKFCM